MLAKILKAKWIVLAIVVVGLLLRTYNARATFLYSHDQDLAGWIIKDILVNGHLRLIGQETSTPGIFIGPIYYYLLIPFYLLTRLDPVGGAVAISILGLATVFSYYFVFSKMFGKFAGALAGLIYAVSFYTVFNDREVVPTTAIMLWSVWYFYALFLLLRAEKLGYLLSGALFGLVWHINMGLALLIPLAPLAVVLSRKKFSWEGAVRAGVALFVLSLPLMAFEIRHGGQQIKALAVAFTTNQNDIVTGLAKVERVIFLANKNAHNFLLAPLPVPFWVSTATLLAGFIFILKKKVISKSLGILMILWWGLLLTFFSAYSKIVSEYYLNPLIVIWVAAVSLGLYYLLSQKKLIILGSLLLLFFVGFNIYRIFTFPVNASGYIQKKALVDFIDNDKKDKGYPCIAVSFITQPGYDMGYRYFFWLKGTYLNKPKEGVPVYTIAFPHSKVGRIDRSFGALGLVLPDYERYNPDMVSGSCDEGNSNLTEPMLLYTE